jgi:hypothetical protein
MTRQQTLTAALGSLAMLGAAALLWPQSVPAVSGAKPDAPTIAASGEPVLLELFTSQGCSSCPPADRLAEKLATHPDLVVIARPVTYWDRLGWKDTLAREDNTALQQDYARRGLAGRNGVYTPQLVVDGRFGAVGSRSDDIAAGVKRYGSAGDATIRAAKRDAGGYAVSLSGTGEGKGELMLVAVTRKVTVGIGSGENGGRKVGYTNVLRAERKIADWQGGTAQVAVRADQLKVVGADAFALVLRAPGGGEVFAARWLT